MFRILIASTIAALSAVPFAFSADAPASRPAEMNVPPKGFTALFNGKDLAGWRGLDANPYEIAKLPENERKARQEADNENMRKHWRVEGGEIINDGHGVFLTTEKNYRDFELYVDWRMMNKGTDSGIYLRCSPQVQIWDSLNQVNPEIGIEKGSGALWNNNGPGKWPLVKADKPVGEWNTFRIRMIGERVSVWFNGQLTVEDAAMENYWNRERPILPTGPIQLQTHGGEMRFRNVFVREIPADEANNWLQSRNQEGLVDAFNGKDFTGWTRGVDAYEIRNGVIVCKPGRGDMLFIDKELSDFTLRFEFKLPPGGNNGVAIRAPMEGNPAFVGMEVQILDDTHEKYKQLKDWQVHGSIYGIAPAHRGYLRPTGEWNYQEVNVKGSQVQVFVNGTKVNEVDLSKAKALDDRDHPGMHRTSGYVGFMGHGDPVEFRNIRYKPL